MPAGGSARRRSAELLDEADALFELAVEKRRDAENYRAACASEQVLAEVLRPLEQRGWTLLEDRLWPDSKRANVDFILVGPAGVVVLDAKNWADLQIRDGSIFRSNVRADEEVDKLARLEDGLLAAIADTGLTSSTIHTAMVFTGRSVAATQVGPITVVGDAATVPWILGLRQRLDAGQVERIAAAIGIACPEMPVAPDPTPSRLRLRRRPAPRVDPDQGSLIDVSAMTDALIEAALAGPIEEWMTFLHPDQSRLVRTQWNGPARVRGPAGTGKTVVALHRAIHQATRSPDPILFVSFVKTLPTVLGGLATRLSAAAADNIEFVGVHALASRCLQVAGQRVRVDKRAADLAFLDAWKRTGASQLLGTIDERPSYWREEIDYVIKGRGLTEFEEYKDLLRVGRKTPMRAEERGYVWDLYAAYDAALDERGIGDFNDLLIKAREAVEAYPALFRYGGVIVDEVQDLTLVALQFLASLAGDGPNRLLLIGDGQQSVYPGGFNLAEAGISVAGRATVLRVNYRNTYEILAEAARLVSSDSFGDLDGEVVPGVRDAEVARHGHRPLRVSASTARDLEAALTSMIMRTRQQLGVPWGDLAVLVQRRKDQEHYERVLGKADIPYVALMDYDGVTTDRVKVGTIKRSKGLEFKYVLMPGLRDGAPDMWPGETEESYGERCERMRRELYVGMTRARDGLWLGYLDDQSVKSNRSGRGSSYS